jgi:hypothetical protein
MEIVGNRKYDQKRCYEIQGEQLRDKIRHTKTKYRYNKEKAVSRVPVHQFRYHGILYHAKSFMVYGINIFLSLLPVVEVP